MKLIVNDTSLIKSAGLNLNLSAAGTVNSNDQANPHSRGLKVVINITAITGTAPTLTVNIQGKDPVSGQYYTILASAALTSVSGVNAPTVITVYPGLPATANQSANDVLPAEFRIQAVAGGTVTSLVATITPIGIQ